MCPSSMLVGGPRGFTWAILFPATSAVTLSAKVSASARHVRAATVSKPEGAGASSRRFRKAMEDELSIRTACGGYVLRAGRILVRPSERWKTVHLSASQAGAGLEERRHHSAACASLSCDR